MSLVEKAARFGVSRRSNELTDEQIDLALAFVRDEVSLTGVSKALGYKTTAQAYLFITRAVKFAYKQGLISIN